MPRPSLYAYEATIAETGEEVGTYYILASAPTPKRRGKAYHLAFLDLKDTDYPDATCHAEVPNLSVKRAPELDE